MSQRTNRSCLAVSAVAAAAVASLTSAPVEAAYIDAVHSLSPYAHYRLDEVSGSVANEANLNGGATYPGTFAGSPTLGVVGPRPTSSPQSFLGFEADNKALNLDQTPAVTDHANLGKLDNFTAGLDAPGAAVTFNLWFRTSNASQTMNLFGMADNNTATLLAITLNQKATTGGSTAFEADSIRLALRDWGTNGNNGNLQSRSAKLDSTSTGGGKATDGNWHMLTVSIKPLATPDPADEPKFYFDGAPVALTNAGSDSIGLTADFRGIEHAFRLGTGGRNTPAATDSSFIGDLDEFSIFTTQLSDAQIAGLYNSAVVPEPVSLTLLPLAGVLGLSLRRRGRAQRA